MEEAKTEPLTREVVERSIADFTAAAKDVRAFFVAFLSITIYIAVVIAGITDLQLVKIDPVTLPTRQSVDLG